MKTKIKLALVALFLTLSVFLAMPAMAEGFSPAVQEGGFFETFLDLKKLDSLEKEVFVQLFGGQFVDEGGTTALSKVIGYMNVVAMAFGVIILGYIIGAGALHTAASGQLLGKSWSSVWLPLRIVVGFGSIMPGTGGSDFSVIQTLMAKLLIVSSIFATSIWGWVSDDILSHNTSFTAGMPLPPTSQAMDLVGSSFCAINEFYQRNGDGRDVPFPLYTIVVGNDEGKSIVKTVVGSPGGSPYTMAGGTYIKSIRFGSTGACGSIEAFDSDISEYKSGTMASIKAASAVIIDTLNNAHQLENEARERKINSRNIDIYLSSSSNSSGEAAIQFQKETAEVASAGAEIIARYPAAMYDAVIGGFRSGTNLEEARSELIPSKSWLLAPMNFIRLTQHSIAPNSVLQKLGEGISNTSWRMCKPGATDCPTRSVDKTVRSISTDYSHVSTMLVIGEIESSTNSLNTSPSVQGASSPSTSTGDGASGCTGNACKQSKFVTDYTSQARKIIFTADLMGEAGQRVADSGKNNQEGLGGLSLGNYLGGSSPYYVLSGIGHALNTLLGITWGAGLAAAAVAHGVGDSALGLAGGGALSGAFDYVLKTTWPLFMGMIMVGASLAYVIPLLPILRWIWAILNWMLLLVEAMTAAPLAVIMLVTPEGEGIAGAKTEKAIMLVAQVLMWPSLLILSYIATVAISNYGFAFINYMWFSDLTHYNDAGFFDLVAKTIIWAVVMVSLCNACSGIIDTIPRVIFEWLGGGMSRSMNNNPEANAEQSIKVAENKINQSVAGATSALKAKPRE
jgi:conjugal transfer/type IV secretion protein DotA/TraY